MVNLKKFVESLRDLLADILQDKRIPEEVRNEYVERLKNLI